MRFFTHEHFEKFGLGKGARRQASGEHPPFAQRELNVLPYQFLMATGLIATTLAVSTTGWTQIAAALNAPASLEIVVNSPEDGPIQADQGLTLREAISLANGTLLPADLSPAEQAQVTPLDAPTAPTYHIGFQLPPEQTTLQLVEELPAIARPGISLDGTTQAGYDPQRSATAEIAIPIPVVAITPAPEAEIFRGLTIVASDVTVRGLSLYGFTAEHQATAVTPPADIFIAHRLPPPDISEQSPPAEDFSFYDTNLAPENVLIEQNWLGIPPDESRTDRPSAFGISVFNSQGTTVRHNYIAHHDGSAIITGARAENLQVQENILVGNGLAGLPDGIRLEGRIDQSTISGNLVCGNDGAGIFLFKPEGSVAIDGNTFKFNGQRLRRAAIYLMGNGHRVMDNTITHQAGPGVVVTAFGTGSRNPSHRNFIQHNRFAHLEGLSIDLNTRRHYGAQDFQRGDGPNPIRNSDNRRLDTGNLAINAPQFMGPAFFSRNGTVIIEGWADPGSVVELYRSQVIPALHHGPLSQPLTTVPVDANGHFEWTTGDLEIGTVISAIASDPRYGTSEPALNAVVRALGVAPSLSPEIATTPELPQCTTRPQPPVPIPPAPIQLEVPRTIHFGLDQADISSASAAVLDQLVGVLLAHPTLVLDLHGHTDSRASDRYNQALALQRASNARAYLIRHGIDPARLTIRAWGETQLLVAETSRSNYARNRRVEFVFHDVRGLDIQFVDQETDLQLEP
jgi:outer membrane protein OmpA-like peptidoglycan-associated protein